ncbi:MAG: murein biosynthesis integral membrane protein MurJ [Acidimicrobiales bacterium]
MSDAPEASTAGEAGLARSGAVVAAGTAASRITGLVRLVVQGWILGELAAFDFANTVPNLLFDLLAGGVLTATLVPVFVENDRRGDAEASNAVWTITSALLLGVTVLGVALAPVIALIGPTSDAEALYRTFLILFIPQVFFYGLTTLASSALNARRRFAAAAFAPVVNNVVAIAVLVIVGRAIAPDTSSDALTDQLLDDPALLWFLGLGTTAGIALQAAVLWPAMRRVGIAVRVRFEPGNPAVRQVLRLSGWVFAYVVTNQVAIMVFLGLATAVEDEIGAPAYTRSWQFFQLPYGLLAASIITAAVPELARLAQSDEHAAFRNRVLGALRLTVLVTVPAAVAFGVLGRPLVSAFFEHGNFGPAATDLTAQMLGAFSVGIVFFSVYLIGIRSFYAARDTRRPFWINLVESVLQVAFGLALLPVLGVPGLALGFSLAYVLGSALVFWVLDRQTGGLPWLDTVRPVLKMAAAGALMAAVMLAVSAGVGGDAGSEAVVRLAVVLPVGALVYLGSCWTLRVDDLRALVSAFRRS